MPTHLQERKVKLPPWLQLNSNEWPRQQLHTKPSKPLRKLLQLKQPERLKLLKQRLLGSLPKRSEFPRRWPQSLSQKRKPYSAPLLPSSREDAKLAVQQVIAHCWQATALQILARQRLVAVEVWVAEAAAWAYQEHLEYDYEN